MRQSTVGRLLAVVLACAGSVLEPAHAYPIHPVALWDLVERADLIVYAEVVSVESVVVRDDFSIDFPGLAHLRTSETWKGRAPHTLTVRYEAGVACPAPGWYIEGERVVAFLERRDGEWHTVERSYGSLYPAADEVAAYRKQIQHALQLQARPPVRERDQLDWLVATAAERGTRWHGLWPLAAFPDRLPRPLSRTADEDRWGSLLEAHHLERIADGFVAAPSLDYTLSMALAVLRGYERDALDRAVVASIETQLRRERLPVWFDRSLRAALHRFGDPRPDRRVEALRVSRGNPDVARVVWQVAREELGIPSVDPRDGPSPREGGD